MPTKKLWSYWKYIWYFSPHPAKFLHLWEWLLPKAPWYFTRKPGTHTPTVEQVSLASSSHSTLNEERDTQCRCLWQGGHQAGPSVGSRVVTAQIVAEERLHWALPPTPLWGAWVHFQITVTWRSCWWHRLQGWAWMEYRHTSCYCILLCCTSYCIFLPIERKTLHQ